jgi:drug/metabolite transporter (DMT)-like permease
MKIRTLFALIFCNLVWSANPAMAKLVFAEGVSPGTMAWLRFASALAAYAVGFAIFRCWHLFRVFRGFHRPGGLSGGESRSPRPVAFLTPRSRADWSWLLLLGVMGFCISPLLQMTGLYASRATDNALIVAMEPLLTVLLAWLILGEAVLAFHWVAFAIALSGFCLLADLTPSRLLLLWGSPGSPEGAHLIGNILILLALLGEACYTIAGRKLLVRHSAYGIFGSALIVGVCTLTIVIGLTQGSSAFISIVGLSWKAWFAIFFMGPLGTAFAYLYWMIALTEAPVASLVLTLFIQPVFGSFWGYRFLGERLSLMQWAGAGLISGAIALLCVVRQLAAATVPGPVSHSTALNSVSR